MMNFKVKTILVVILSLFLVSTAGAFYGNNPGLSSGTGGYYNTPYYGSSYNNYYGGYSGNGYNTTYGYNVSGPVAQPLTQNRAPVFSSKAVINAQVGVLYSYFAQATDQDGDIILYTLAQSPTGMSINSNTGLISWTPAPSQASRRFTVQISATDSTGLSATQSYAVSVGGSAPAPQSATPTQNIAGNSAYNPQASIFSIFRRSSEPEELAISNITAFSGPQNIYDGKTVNCSVYVNWNTNLPTSGQVVYGDFSQADTETFIYPLSATEPNSLSTEHQVKLDCLEDKTYYFRVIAFASDDRVVSDEFTIIPFRIENPMGGGFMGGDGLASIFGSAGRLALPFIILLFSLVIIYLAIKRIRRRVAVRRNKSTNSIPEPVINIPGTAPTE